MIETIIGIVGAFIVSIIGMFLVSKFNVSIFGLKLNFTNNKHVKKPIDTMITDILEYSNKIHEYNNKIMSNSMIYVVGKLTQVQLHLRLTYDLYKVFYISGLIKTVIKESFLHNGFTDMNAPHYEEYVRLKTGEIQSVCDKELGIPNDEFIHSKDFQEIIMDIYNHFVECHKHWTKAIKDETISFSKRYK